MTRGLFLVLFPSLLTSTKGEINPVAMFSHKRDDRAIRMNNFVVVVVVVGRWVSSTSLECVVCDFLAGSYNLSHSFGTKGTDFGKVR